MQGRARLIWAANTAEAWGSLGSDTWLGTQGKALSFNAGPLHDLHLGNPPADFRQFYGIDGAFRILASPYPWWRVLGGRKVRESGAWEAQTYLPWHVFPHIGVVHTRDFRIVEKAVAQNIPTIYEDHNETYHTAIRTFPRRIVHHPAFRVAVSTTSAIRDRLIASGVPAEKTLVAWSGLNARSLEPVGAARIEAIRRKYMRTGARHLVTYAGGLHHCRGVAMLLRLAKDHPELDILVLGGREGHASNLRRQGEERRMKNLHVLGYQPQTRVPEFLQASDVLLLPYMDPAEARVTSPLKFFEYLAAGRPVVSAQLPELQSFASHKSLGVVWCPIGDYDAFRDSLRKLLPSGGRQSSRFLHRELARSYTWAERQKRIMAAAGIAVRSAPAAAVSEVNARQTVPVPGALIASGDTESRF